MSVESSTRAGSIVYRGVGRERPWCMTFGEYAERWIEGQRRLVETGMIRPNSLMRVESALAAHLLPAFAAYRLDDLTRERCEAFRGGALREPLLCSKDDQLDFCGVSPDRAARYSGSGDARTRSHPRNQADFCWSPSF